MSHVVVIGAGITGLTVGYELLEAGIETTVFEAGNRVGGKLHTVDWLGRRVDVGADAFLARHQAAQELARRVGLGDDLVEPATGQVWLWIRDRLRPLPEGTVLGAPTSLIALARSRVLGSAGLVRAAAEPFLPWRPTAGDRSVADVLGERFGPDVVDRLVEPLLGGVYAGRADELSVQSTAPMIAEAMRTKRSLTAALRDHRHRTVGASLGPVFQTLAGGLQRLPDELAGRLGGRVSLETPVVAVEPTADVGWRVTTTAGVVDADAVVLCVPAHRAADLLLPASRTVAAELAGIAYASVAVVTLAYGPHARDELPPGSGMLVPRSEGRLVKASTWVSRKWPHQAGGDHMLLRASVGRIDDARWRDLDEDDLITRVDAEIRRATGMSRPAQEAIVTRWERSLPQYVVGHAARVDRIRAELPDGIFVAGAAYDGVGISPCVASARAAARGAAIHARRPAET